MKKFVFNRRTADTDSVSISKIKNVITTRSGRQVNPPKKLMFMIIYELIIYLFIIIQLFVIYL